MTWEASRTARCAPRAYARLVLEHRLAAQDPLAVDASDDEVAALLLPDRNVALADVMSLLA